MARSYTQLKQLFKDLTTNQSTSNDTLAGTLINLAYPYHLQKYFDNERVTSITTVGPQVLTLTATPSAGSSSAILTSTWTYLSTYQLVVFSDGEQRRVNFTQNSATITWSGGLIGTPAGQVTSASSSTNVITFSNSNGTINNGQALVFAGSGLPSGISAGTTYYVGNATNTTFKLYTDSTLSTVVTILGTGTGTFSAPFTDVINTMGVATYPLPNNVSKLKNTTINVGQLVYTAVPVSSVQQWTAINALPYSAEIVAYFFVYQGFINFWPIPSETGDVVDLYYQLKVADMTYADYSTGTIGNFSAGSNQVVGSGTGWTAASFGNFNSDIIDANLNLIINPPYGDGRPYLIQSFSSATQANLYKPIAYSNGTGGNVTYSIGQYPILFGDFDDILVYWALLTYYSSIVNDPQRYQMYNKIYSEKLAYMEGYLSTKSVNVDLDASSLQISQNPNLFPMASLRDL